MRGHSYAFYQKSNNLLPVPWEACEAAAEHAVRENPNESVGVVIGGVYYPMTNVAQNPMDTFAINPAEFASIVTRVGPLEAVIHSHPSGFVYPSPLDMRTQIEWEVPFGIIAVKNRLFQDIVFFGDQVPRAPIIGRPFIHGVYDCYATARDRLKSEYSISIPDLPRSHKWWDQAEGDNNILMGNYERFGFYEIDFSELQAGDVFLGSVGFHSRVNHCGIYEGNGLILHHIFGSDGNIRLSTQESIYQWKRFIVKCLRHKSKLQVPANAAST